MAFIPSANSIAQAMQKARTTKPNYSQNPEKRFGTVSAYTSGNLNASVIFDGEDTAAAYSFLDTYIPVVGDRVALDRRGNTWLIQGSIGSGGVAGKPLVRLVAATTQNLANNTAVALNFTAEDFDTHNMHSTSSNTSRITVTKPGYYRFMGAAAFAARSDYFTINIWIRVNGASNLAPASRIGPSTSQIWMTQTQAMQYMNVGDYAEVVVQQANTAAVAVDTNRSGQYSPVFEAEFISP